MKNIHQNLELNKIDLDISDKIYLIICSGILIGMLFTVTKKKSLF